MREFSFVRRLPGSKALPASSGVLEALEGARRLLGEEQGVKAPFPSRWRVNVAGVEDAVELLAVEGLDHRAQIGEILAGPVLQEARKVVRATTVNAAVL